MPATAVTPPEAAAARPISKALYVGPFVHSVSLQDLDICATGAIGVDENGIIAFVERDVQNSDAAAAQLLGAKGGDWPGARVVRIRHAAGFFFPGFIDTHIHASQYPNAGLFGTSTLLDWLTTYTFPAESSLSSLPLAHRVYSRCVARTLSHGTTTAAYYATIHVPATALLARLCLAAGQRAFVGRVCMDAPAPRCPDWYRDADSAAALAATHDAIAAVQALDAGRGLVAPILTPRFAPACERDTLAALGQLLQRSPGLLAQTHVAENAGEIAWVKELFPEAAHYVDVYGRAGLLGPRTVLAHAVHVSAEERAELARTGTKVAHCPASNTALGSGAAGVRRLLDAGVTVGLGTDVSAGASVSVLEAVRHAVWASRHRAIMDAEEVASGASGASKESSGKQNGHTETDSSSCCNGNGNADPDRAKLTHAEALYLATRGGAAVLSLADKVGGFAVGMEWDAQMVGLNALASSPTTTEGEMGGVGDTGDLDIPVDVFGTESLADCVAKWVYGGDERNTLAVWVRGRAVRVRQGVVV
ncbi:uncharacterized protein K452DRAFT_265757 [Aplosporella prunicola CBS 121167]|uniref:Amidohydrolase-related domain-containing protein n=1 Tax=Aplosporella prunicola CBS 121167 TaxID=1176127 RepID=A0A6A6BLZ1_9PEZI|nr:uncharacterized protein K452DRAFT_265757 [Aplosporella prunicola CBS 121167]KAF2145122.1 hypothetical protein K452DRAFT_265757 [Aplosporella prunicola CBS 121167]